MANKDFKVKNGLDIQTPLPVSMGGTGQTSTTNTLNSLLPAQSGNASKVLQTDGTNASWVTLPNGYQKGNTASRPGSPSVGDIYSNTETGYIEVYTSAGWSQLGVIPAIPSIGSATDVGTNIAYGSGSASVTFTPAVTGGLASSFTVTSTSGGYSASGSSSPIVVSNIPTGTSATFTVTATNGYGNSLATTASNSITTTSVPQVPTIGTASKPAAVAYSGTSTASLTFTAGATGGKSITNYKYSTDGTTYTAFSPAQTTSPLTITGLVNGQSYSFYLKAVNANGDSIASSTSNSVTVSTVPQTPTIGTVTATNGTTVSIPFTAGATGGSTITSYTITSSPSISLSYSGTTSPMTVTGAFASNQAYTFTISAVNANGTSVSSSSSNSVTPFAFSASGGTTYTSGGYTYHKFTSNGTFAISSATSNKNFDLIVIGGGGASGYGNIGGGGGGAGTVGYYSGLSLGSGTSIGITIGAGGTSSGVTTAAGNKGTATSLGSYLTSPGGGGGGSQGSGKAGTTGGSGGGGGSDGASGGGGANGTIGLTGSLAATSTGYAFAGGQGGGNTYGSGGGGGAGGGGATQSAGVGGVGGTGTNAFSTWMTATSSGSGGFIAGGGAGANASANTRVAGGAGGGGDGGYSGVPGLDGLVNTGSGGGGGNNGGGGAGGSGIVILRYPV